MRLRSALTNADTLQYKGQSAPQLLHLQKDSFDMADTKDLPVMRCALCSKPFNKGMPLAGHDHGAFTSQQLMHRRVHLEETRLLLQVAKSGGPSHSIPCVHSVCKGKSTM
jgi:hypothetical protein